MAAHFSEPSQKPTKSKKAPAAAAYRSRSGAEAYVAKRRAGSGGRRARTVGIVIAVILVALLVAGGTMGVMLYQSAMGVRDNASHILSQANVLKEGLENGDEEALTSSMGVIVEKTNEVNAEVHSSLWNVATLIPVVGEDIRSVQTLGSSAHSLVNDALVPIVSNLSGFSLSEIFQDGVVNVSLIETLSNALSSAMPVIQNAASEISALPEAHIPQLRDVLSRVQEPIGEVQGLLDGVQPILDVLPQMFGANGQSRTYLVIAQNNSELRATGGLPGSWGTVTITDGAISMGEFRTILHQSGLEVQITEDEAHAIATNMNTDPAQVNCTADFVRVGQLSRDYWAQMGMGDVNGVIAIDPVFLQRLLSLTGGFTASDGTAVDGTNAAKVLLSDTYWKFGNDGEAQDEYFSSVASLAFEQIMNNLGNADMGQLLDVIEQSGKDGRLLVWMLDDSEEQAMKDLGFSGELKTDPTEPVLGVYFNDDTYSKINWYTSTATTFGEGVKNADGTTTYDVTTTLTNNITQEEADSAPTYIRGSNIDKRDNSDMILFAFFYGPAGGSISDFAISEGGMLETYGIANESLSGLQVIRTRVHARAGETVTFTYKVTVSAEAAQPLALRTTPLAQESLMQTSS